MQGLVAYEGRLCTGCGWHENLTGDKSVHFTFETPVCPVCAGSDRFSRVLHDADQRHAKALGDKPHPAHTLPADGRRVVSRLLSPDEVQERRSR